MHCAWTDAREREWINHWWLMETMVVVGFGETTDGGQNDRLSFKADEVRPRNRTWRGRWRFLI
jgi:hypothetical protein